MRRVLAVLPLLLVLAAPAAAPAQAGGFPAGNYGGGAVPAPPSPPYGNGAITVGLRAAGGAPAFSAIVGSRCGHGFVVTTLPVAADGTFRRSGRTVRQDGFVRVATSWRVAGGVGASGAGGSLRATIRAQGRTCRARASWRARRLASGAIGTPGRNANDLFGTTSQRLGGARHGVVLRMRDGGRTLLRALYGIGDRCNGRFRSTTNFDTPRRRLRVSAGGRVRDVERFRIRLNRNLVARGVETFSATIGSAGARGTASVRYRTVDRRTGRTVSSCSTGRVRFTAAPR